MCDIDGGFDVDFSTNSDIEDSSADSFDVEVSDIGDMSDIEDVSDDLGVADYFQDMEESFESSDFEEIESYPNLSEYDDINEQTGVVEELNISDQLEDIDHQEEMTNTDGNPSLTGIDAVEPEMTFTREKIQELYDEQAENPEFGDKTGELISSGRVAISEMEDIDESGEEGVKVLIREITPEILESRERDTEEVLDNYRENLRERGVSEDRIEEFVEHEREGINAEYESLDAGKTSENIYYMPTDWEAVVESLENTENGGSTEVREENESFQLDDEETTDSEDVPSEDNDNVEGDKNIDFYQTISETHEESEKEYLGDLRQQPTEVYGIPENSPELESIMQNERLGWDEIHENDSSEDNQESLAEMFLTDELSESSGSDGNGLEISDITSLSDMDDINAEEIETVTEDIDSPELEETSPIIEDNSLVRTGENIEANISEEIEEGDISIDESGVINDSHDESIATEENPHEITENNDWVGEIPDIVEETPLVEENRSIDINEPQEIEVNYDEIYDVISQERLEQGFENVDIYEDAERLDASLDNFAANTWENLSIDDRKQSMNGLAEYIEEVIGFDNPPRIEYYNNPREGDYGGYNSRTNTLNINEYMLYNNSEAADTIAHELWHAHQHECADHPSSARDYQYQYNFENYIRPEMGHEAYEGQLIEAEARAFAAQFKGRLEEIGSRRI
ncbi:hypothetical protein SAMN04487770_12957 [Butyrivibrio sp. ob235]|uniref:hypothetical protein n=1 Tax=Butyrivibrio sp. ob235 TaxID=1761780 RepID=UPI0008ACCCE1|nr:hypothetical protein [Butyrivibrio sp. ob235]SEM23159.1 hypothetical protein SAMN04487770_12957 [Butyrivibrio sp. ob235]